MLRTLTLGSLAGLALAIPTHKDGALRKVGKKEAQEVKTRDWKHMWKNGARGVSESEADCVEDGQCPSGLIGTGECCSVDTEARICGHPFTGRPNVFAPRMGSPCPGRPRVFCCDTSDPTEVCPPLCDYDAGLGDAGGLPTQRPYECHPKYCDSGEIGSPDHPGAESGTFDPNGLDPAGVPIGAQHGADYDHKDPDALPCTTDDPNGDKKSECVPFGHNDKSADGPGKEHTWKHTWKHAWNKAKESMTWEQKKAKSEQHLWKQPGH